MSSKTSNPISLVQRNPLVSFFILTYALCWGVGAILKGAPIIAPDGLFVGGVLVSALTIAGLTNGRAGLRDLGHRLVQWRVAPRWYAVVLLLPAVIVGTSVALMPLFGGASLDWSARPSLVPTAVMLVAFIILPLGAPFAEEVAWRGFALPRLLAQHSPLMASLILGVFWSLWHIPVILSDPGLRAPAPFLLMVLPLSILFTWISLRTGGSVFIAVLFHAWYDLVLVFVAAMLPRGDYALMFWLIFAMQSVVAVVVVLLARDRVDRSSLGTVSPARLLPHPRRGLQVEAVQG